MTLAPLLRLIPHITRHVGRSVVQTGMTIRATAVAWTAGEVSGRAIDAGFVHMPSVNSARAFLAVFGIVLLVEIGHAAGKELREVSTHIPERRPVQFATLEDRGANARRTLAEWLPQSPDGP